MALPTQDLVRPIKNNQVTISQILYIIDTCYSQSGAGDIIKFLSNAIKQYEAVRGANIAIHRKFGSETPPFYDGFTVKYEHRLRNIC